ncbi:DUF7489 domain-containing protein [Candidatus Contubernalis alkaliaceticus]|uniref:DUF7489 domain-containing protein n=1 Tax=Candidatus Contubernalis alkaliaceticus TaxID=338645 RepID=UPI001F4C1E7D|nr:hypothetical protein [Candidatus Contubernalis alkalaceticus]UNC92614.1 hypothetical protein HUE98_11185 [Candidatus Contubernalis alkalaceticus]
MDRVFLLICLMGIFVFLYIVIRRAIAGIVYPFIFFEGKVVSRSYKTKVVEDEEDIQDIEEEYTLEVKMPNGKNKNYSVNSRLYNSVKEGDYVRKDKGSRTLKKGRKKSKKKKNKKK